MEPSNVYVASNSTEVEIGSKEIVKYPSLICAPVMADSIDMMVFETFKAQELGDDLVEFRLDWLKDFNPLEEDQQSASISIKKGVYGSPESGTVSARCFQGQSFRDSLFSGTVSARCFLVRNK